MIKLMNQKGFIALIFFVVCLCLSAVIVGLSYYYVHHKPIENQELTGTEEKLSNKILQNESPSTVGNKKPLLLYSYSYKQFGKDNQQTFKLDPSNMNKQEIQIGYDYGKKWFKSSPDGKYLLRYGLEKLEIADSTNLSTFKTLVELDGFNSYIDIFNVYWSNDASKILYVLDKKTLFSENTEIYLINKDGSNNKLVKLTMPRNGILMIEYGKTYDVNDVELGMFFFRK